MDRIGCKTEGKPNAIGSLNVNANKKVSTSFPQSLRLILTDSSHRMMMRRNLISVNFSFVSSMCVYASAEKQLGERVCESFEMTQEVRSKDGCDGHGIAPAWGPRIGQHSRRNTTFCRARNGVLRIKLSCSLATPAMSGQRKVDKNQAS